MRERRRERERKNEKKKEEMVSYWILHTIYMNSMYQLNTH